MSEEAASITSLEKPTFRMGRLIVFRRGTSVTPGFYEISVCETELASSMALGAHGTSTKREMLANQSF